MPKVKNYFERLEEELPDLVGVEDLIRFGFYRSTQSAYEARVTGDCPDYLRIPSRGIVYLKRSVIDFLKGNTQNSPKTKTIKSSRNSNGLKTHAKASTIE